MLQSSYRLKVSAVVFTLSQLRMSCSTTVAVSPLRQPSISFLTAAQSKQVDERLMQSPGFSIDQLMELAGLSVAHAAFNFGSERQLVSKRSSTKNNRVLVVCGPGNNGGDGLVAARHLKHFGLHPSIVYPKQSRGVLFTNLVQQLNDLGIPILPQMPPSPDLPDYAFAIDALFGFSFVGPPREPFVSIIQSLRESKMPVISLDLPSGWDVEQGDIHSTGFLPDAVVSLTAPKQCMRDYQGAHYVGGRFVPPAIAQELGITLPDYGYGNAQYVLLSGGSGYQQKKSPEKAAAPEPVSAMFVTVPSAEEAQRIAQSLLERRLVACVNMLPQVQSMYVWEGKVETSQEVLMMIKTRRSLVEEVTAAVRGLHSYEVPESIAFDVAAGSAAYLDWVRQSTAGRTPVGKLGTVDAVTGSVVESADPVTEAAVTQKYTEEGTSDAGSV